MKLFFKLKLVILFVSVNVHAQTPTSKRINSFQEIKKEASPIDGVKFRNIGPTIMSGRVTDVEVNPENPNEMYVAYASGGIFYSMNNGQSMTPIFDNQATLTIGDMYMDWKNHTLWVGTGEVNSSRSSYAGTGIYKSSDTGKTWNYVGLSESHHIGRIIVHPNNPNIAWVAVLGHLYTPNPERGIYKTEDGGKNWKQTLFVNDTTGCVDLVLDPNNPSTLYTAAWTRTRSAWNFNGSGEQSGIYKSTDGGNIWSKLTTPQSGFPNGKGVGRIGLSLCASNSNIMYAVLDNNANQEKKEAKEDSKLKARDIKLMNANTFLKLDDKKLNSYLRENGYPSKYTAESVKKSIQQKEFTVADVADWKLADADANLFDTPIYGAELYRSNDAGKTWKRTHDKPLEGVVFTYGYYFGTIGVSPTNPDKVAIAGYPIILSYDGGKTFKQIDGDNCHPDYHRIWMNPKNDKHIIVGNDGGVNITYDDGENWYKANNPAVGQFYAVQVDEAKPYNVYGGLQDNGTWTASSATVESKAWHQTGEYPYKGIGDGDGMQVQVDTRNNATVFVGYQFGNYFKSNKNTNDAVDVKPVHDIGKKPFRFNWQTPIWLSRHNQDVFYIGSNCFHRSLLQGDNLETLSQDLAPTSLKGNVPFGTLTTIAESPKKFGLIYVGSDNGNIHVSKDLGYNWTKISNTLPQNLWVSRVTPSKFKEARTYVSLNGYRNDDFNPYLYVSEDYGRTWNQLGMQLPMEPINVVKEDPQNENILYVGTDNGFYISFNKGVDFILWNGNLPRVAVHDVAIQERENEILIGTHGRSLYIAKLNLVQEYPKVKNKSLFVFDLKSVNYNSNWGQKYASYAEPFETKMALDYFTNQAGRHTIHVLNEKGKVIQTIYHDAIYGMNSTEYDMSADSNSKSARSEEFAKGENDKFYLKPGKYAVEIVSPSGEKMQKQFEVKEEKEE